VSQVRIPAKARSNGKIENVSPQVGKLANASPAPAADRGENIDTSTAQTAGETGERFPSP
jgi:hypothetical protein